MNLNSCVNYAHFRKSGHKYGITCYNITEGTYLIVLVYRQVAALYQNTIAKSICLSYILAYLDRLDTCLVYRATIPLSSKLIQICVLFLPDFMNL